MYVINKGMTFTDFFYYNEEKGEPNLKYIDSHKGDGELHGMGFIPKRQVNFMQSEVNRGIRFTQKSAEWISFKLPRKSEAFSEEIFPPCYKGEAVLTYDEWAGGKNVKPASLDMSTIP